MKIISDAADNNALIMLLINNDPISEHLKEKSDCILKVQKINFF